MEAIGVQVCSRPSPQVSLRRLFPEAHGLAPTTMSAWGPACATRGRPGPACCSPRCRGARCDGHDFIAEAVARGATAILSQRPAAEFGLPNCVVADSRDAYGRICQALAGNPSHRLKLIGVTGTNGKTTTSCLIASVLATAGHPVGLLGTLGYFDGETCEPASLTTPPPDALGRLAGPHGRQRLHARGDGSLQPCPEPVAGGGRPLRRRLRDQRQPRPPRLSPHDPGLPAGEVEALRAPGARGLRRDQRRRSGRRRLPRPLRRPGLDRRHPLGRGNHRHAARRMPQRTDVSAHGRQRDASRCRRG